MPKCPVCGKDLNIKECVCPSCGTDVSGFFSRERLYLSPLGDDEINEYEKILRIRRETPGIKAARIRRIRRIVIFLSLLLLLAAASVITYVISPDIGRYVIGASVAAAFITVICAVGKNIRAGALVSVLFAAVYFTAAAFSNIYPGLRGMFIAFFAASAAVCAVQTALSYKNFKDDTSPDAGFVVPALFVSVPVFIVNIFVISQLFRGYEYKPAWLISFVAILALSLAASAVIFIYTSYNNFEGKHVSSLLIYVSAAALIVSLFSAILYPVIAGFRVFDFHFPEPPASAELTSAPESAAEYEDTYVENSLRYSLNRDKASYALTGAEDDTLTELNIPERVNGLPVTAIGYMAFYSKNITSVTMPDTIETVSEYAFEYCSSLANVRFSSNLKSIGNRAFYSCHLTELDLPDTVESIGNNAFAFTDVQTVKIPANLSDAGANPFLGCSDLLYFTVDENNTNFEYENGILYNKTAQAAVSALQSLAGRVEIRDGTEIIGTETFWHCGEITELIIPDSVTYIGNYAFNGCTGLDGIRLPSSVASMGSNPFVCYNGFKNLTVDKNNETYVMINGMLYDKVTKTVVSAIRSITEAAIIPLGAEKIGAYAFYEIRHITGVYIPSTVKEIGSSAFSTCINLKQITVPDQVTSIAINTFEFCYALADVNLPDGLETIDIGAFSYCKSLASVSIPGSVRSIYLKAFDGCESLGSIYYGGSEEEWNEILGQISAFTPPENAIVYFAK